MNRQNYSRFERGEVNATLLTVARLATAIGVDGQALLAAPERAQGLTYSDVATIAGQMHARLRRHLPEQASEPCPPLMLAELLLDLSRKQLGMTKDA